MYTTGSRTFSALAATPVRARSALLHLDSYDVKRVVYCQVESVEFVVISTVFSLLHSRHSVIIGAQTFPHLGQDHPRF